MGGKARSYGFVGGYSGKAVMELLDKMGIPHDFTYTNIATAINFIIKDTKTNRETELIGHNAPISDKELRNLMRKLEECNPPPSFMIISGNTIKSISPDICEQLIKISRARGIKVILDTGGEDLRKGIGASPYLIQSDVHEMEKLLHTNLLTEKSIIRTARTLLNENVEIIVIPQEDGDFLTISKDITLKITSKKLKTQYPSETRDCTIAGIIMGLDQGKTLREACLLGGSMGAATTSTLNTPLCQRDNVEKIMPHINVEEISKTIINKADRDLSQTIFGGRSSPPISISINRDSPGDEVHLRRMSVEEAIPTLNRYLDRAFVAGLHSVRIIHGKGTGTIRQVVVEQLTDNPLIKSYRPARPDEGGGGVIIAELSNH